MQIRRRKPIHEQFFTVREKLPVYIAWMYQRMVKPIPLAYHLEIEIHLIRQGHGSYFIQNNIYPFQKNSLIIIGSNLIHCLIPSPDCVLGKMMVAFSPQFLRTTRPPAALFADLGCHLKLTDPEAAVFEMIIRNVDEEMAERNPYRDELIRIKLEEFVCLIKRIGVRPELPPLQNPLVSQLLAHMEAHFAQPLKNPDLARTFGFSSSYLSHLFKKHMGVGLKQYILQRRIVEAQKLLAERAAWKVSAIAEHVGFSDFTVFNKMFKHLTRLTPTAYRRICHAHS